MSSASPASEPSSTDTAGADRFQFGANWRRFLATVSEDRITAAMHSLSRVLGAEGLRDRTFLDIGSGSGLFSLAAVRLGARVCSFDFDADSVACALELRRREGTDAARWRIEQGSVLDASYLQSLGQFDVVYSWGVLHHTGQMWTAIANSLELVQPGGRYWIAIYNDQGPVSRIWWSIKNIYVRLPRWLRTPYVCLVGAIYFSQRLLVKLATTCGRVLLQFVSGRESTAAVAPREEPLAASQRKRGMHLWYDLVDWVGGYPFEVATPEAIVRFCHDRGFQLQELTTCGGRLGCNEFVFVRGVSLCPPDPAEPVETSA